MKFLSKKMSELLQGLVCDDNTVGGWQIVVYGNKNACAEFMCSTVEDAEKALRLIKEAREKINLPTNRAVRRQLLSMGWRNRKFDYGVEMKIE